ncbi:cytochrome o ubiquinol oxidase subunit IV [Ferrovum myxofaciens]|jgi:cytochrome o ubiquinol oxidase operon protein cyoD|uniref:Cytochrome bo(3) ubiquinol oxidase subunit 4 n=2 Tax=root TaxID=1 RepID=A0A8F3IK67_9PROT|nr:cytochrome o ubiquinol oxidase subunit IV [Ferrovum myxofaciens]MBW8029182.1 cytochrome o ubiquinol oxidase subunit IV [Ferrovum sp.]KXW58116.1 cytochrome bo(3) ubiquinol oxidase subunit 4 [Ferrovum myxofaciens]MBU6995750.1 cytochrome o ubiquinol oxidase subunit IV [Ferrovum myxofaciens]QKE39460.1 MAG: cytochrome o ubiquinol oxidase subunit IV [Ferrovum myxofaciens]QKE42077.1 MAG: cytochrome o ubiquinol oxidase subunit IV [Ferrovum myxofaciens]
MKTSVPSHGSLRSYLGGFAASLFLTLASFGLVLYGPHLESSFLFGILALLAILQITVQIYFFLHVDTSSEQLWHLLPLLYTLLIVILLVGGTLWIMHNANLHMMSGMDP